MHSRIFIYSHAVSRIIAVHVSQCCILSRVLYSAYYEVNVTAVVVFPFMGV